MKFVHTADWQLGHVFGHEESIAAGLRQARLDAVKNVLALAAREHAEFILAAGDLFEHNRIDLRVLEEVARLVSESPVPFYLLPGNHDPIMQDSPYLRHQGLFQGNAVVLGRSEAVLLPGGAGSLFPCPARSRSSADDPTRWIPAREPSHGIRVGMAHGPLLGTPDQAGYHIPKNAAESLDLDYLALGHWHKATKVTDRTWYSGTPEPTSFAEYGGKALTVEIARPGAVPVVREFRVATYDWQEIEIVVHGSEDLQSLETQVNSLGDPQMTLLRVRLNGTLDRTLLGEVEAVEKRLVSRFFHLALENRTTVATGAVEYRHPLLREMAETLTTRTSSADTTEAEAARRALSHLAFLVQEAALSDLQ